MTKFSTYDKVKENFALIYSYLCAIELPNSFLCSMTTLIGSQVPQNLFQNFSSPYPKKVEKSSSSSSSSSIYLS